MNNAPPVLMHKPAMVSVSIPETALCWLTLHPNGQRLYASNKQTSFLGVIDLIKRRVVTQIDMPIAEGVAMLLYPTDGSRLYVASHAAPELNVHRYPHGETD